ncbi:MAG: M28 family peptidase [Gemmatimonadales bacterium]
MLRTTAVLLILAAPLAAQAPAPGRNPALERATATITEADVKRRIHIIADDSMLGRDTPSRGLDLTAQYVADEFRRFGLKPGGEDGTFFQRYPIIRWKLDPVASHIGFMAQGEHRHVGLDRLARYWYGAVPEEEIGGEAVVLAGPLDAQALPAGALAGKVAMIALDRSPGASSRDARRMLSVLSAAGPVAVVILSNRDSAAFAADVGRQEAVRMSVGSEPRGGLPILELLDGAAAPTLSRYGIDLAALRGASSFTSRAVPGLRVMVDIKREIVDRQTAPNVIGILPGADPRLRNEYVVYSAHMDHIGVRSGLTPDSINNGADDDGSGTVGLMELAEAFSRPGVRPRRSILFLGVSGEEKGLWGSSYFASHPTVPITSMVADLNMDMIGRNWADTIVAIGKEHSDLGETLNRVNAAHPELHMTAIDDRWPEENFYRRSDHFNFARRGVPILFFFNGVHADYHRVTDSPDKINGEKEARILRLLFYLGQEIANAPDRPKWNPQSYKEIVEGQ